MAIGNINSIPKDTAAEFIANQPFVGLYLMFYRHPLMGNHVLTKNFRHNGSLQDAMERAMEYCKNLGLKLMFVEPLISDLAKEEAKHFNMSNLEAAAGPGAEGQKK